MNVAIIPARGGSKRIPGKNTRVFCGRPIIAYAIETARASGLFSRVIVSTDSDAIATVAAECGAEAPFRRPAELADDSAGTAPVLVHALDWLRDNGSAPEFACCLYPTAVFTTVQMLRSGLETLTATGATTVIPVATFEYPVQRALQLASDGTLSMIWPEYLDSRSQALPEALHDTGQFYWLNVGRYRDLPTPSLFAPDTRAIVVPRSRVIDIDTEEDWACAEQRFRLQRATPIAPDPEDGQPVPHNRLTHGIGEVEAVRDTIESGFWVGGSKVDELEVALEKVGGVRHAVCVASGLSALRLTLKGLGVERGSNVLVPAYSCVALANAVLSCGGAPVPVDVTDGDWNLSIEEGGKKRIETRPSAAIGISMFGAPAAIDEMRAWGMPVIEDCAHAFGAAVGGKPFGSRADASVLSFYATKLIAGGKGGAVLTDSDELAAFVRSWRDYANKAPDGERLNDTMSDIEAALVLCQLDRLGDMIARRRAIAVRYNEMLAHTAERSGHFRVPDASRRGVWYRYTVEMRVGSARDVVEMMDAYGVGSARPVEDWVRDSYGRYPVAERAYRCVVSLPAYPTLTDEEHERAACAFLKAVERFSHA